MIMLAAGVPARARRSATRGRLAVAEAIAGDLIRLADGRIVRLAGIRVPAPDDGESGAQPFAERARAELSTLLDGRP